MTWSSTNPSIATVSNGVVTPVSVGVTTIRAISTIDTGVSATAQVTITNDPVPVTGVTLNRDTLNLTLNSTSQLTATIAPSSASNKTVSWASTNSNIASVSSTGLVTAKSLGTATISVTTQDGNFSDSVLVTVSSQPRVTSITGSFYNTNGNNNGGDNGVTVTNLNNGISSVNALGFGGTTVVTDVVVTQGYFPRSNGLALGSSSSSGSLKLALAEAYHAYKVDVLFNAAGISGTTVGVTGNGGVKTSTSGTIGTAGSNPSSGTPYSVEFTNPSSEITITTSNRTAIVSIVIQYANDTSGDTIHIEATTWADNFLAMTHDGCAAFSRDELTQVWDDAAISFNALSSEAKAIISGTTPNGDGDDIEEAVARYVVIVTNYQLSEFIPGVLITQPSRTVYEISPESKTFTIVGGLTLLGLVIGFIFVDKKLRKTY